MQEEADILACYPSSMDHMTQESIVGLCQGFSAFTSQFQESEAECHTIAAKNCIYFLRQVSEDVFVVLIVQHPGSGERPIESGVLSAILKHLLNTYLLLHGEFLGSSFNLFLQVYLPAIDFTQLRFFTDINGFQFMPLDKSCFMQVQHVLSAISAYSPSLIESVSCIYNHKLLYAGLNNDDMMVLYNMEQPHLRGLFDYMSSPSCPSTPSSSSSVFLTGPLRVTSPTADLPVIFLNSQARRLLAYTRAGVCIYVVLHDDETMDALRISTDLCAMLDDALDTLGPVLAEQARSSRGTKDPFRFLYFNRMNMALKSSLHDRSRSLSTDLIQMLMKLHHDLNSEASPEEIIVKTRTSGWIVGKRDSIESREYFLLLDDSITELHEVQAQVDEFASIYLTGIHMS